MAAQRLILFDVDGTLVDSQHMIVAAVTHAFAIERITLPEREEILSIVGLSLYEAMMVLGNNAPDFPAEVLAGHYRTAFRELRLGGQHDELLFPGSREVIERLSARDDLLLGLATGKSMRGVRAILENHGMEGRFLTIQTADDNPSKPDPGMVNRAMAELGVQPADTVVVGDTAWDMRMARAAGACAIGVGWGYHVRGRLVEAGAATILSSFDELDGALMATML